MSWIDTLLFDGGSIDIKIDYYSAEHKALLETLPPPYAERVKSVAGRTISVSAVEFLTYLIFGYKNSRIPNLSDYRRLRNRLVRHLGEVEEALELSQTSLRSKLSGNLQVKGVTEDIGIGISLTVVSSLLGLSEADWDPIPIGDEKSLDYSIASDGVNFIEVESKGSSVDHPSTEKSPPIYAHASSIGEKKIVQRASSRAIRGLYFGTIGVIDTRPAGIMQCWLLDPEGSLHKRSPADQQVINRLRFAERLIEEIMPHSQILAALKQRLAAIAETDSLSRFENDPLVPWEPRRWQDLAFRHISDERHEFAGRVVELSEGRLFFYGLHFQLIRTVWRQNFQEIRRMDIQVGQFSALLKGELGAVEPREGTFLQTKHDEALSGFQGVGDLHLTASGRVFGLVKSLRHTTRSS